MSKIAIIGASYLQLPLYLKASELKIKTIGFAWEEGAVAKGNCNKFYPISIIEKDKILKICQQEKIDGILTIASDVAVPTVNFVASSMNLMGNSIESSLLTTNKFLMRQKLKKAAINCPAFVSVESIDNLETIFKKTPLPCIVKPTDRSGSKGVTKIDDIADLKTAVETALNESLSNSAIIESFIQGLEVSVESISYRGKHFILAVTDKVTSGAPHFVELEHHQPSLLSKNIQETIKKETKKALNALQIKNGAAHSEFMISEDNIFITEVGARMGGDFIGSDLVYLSTGYDFLKGVIQVALNKFETPEFSWDKSSGVLFYSDKTPKVKQMVNKPDVAVYVKQLEFIEDQLKPLRQSSDRSGYFIYQADQKISYNLKPQPCNHLP